MGGLQKQHQVVETCAIEQSKDEMVVVEPGGVLLEWWRQDDGLVRHQNLISHSGADDKNNWQFRRAILGPMGSLSFYFPVEDGLPSHALWLRARDIQHPYTTFHLPSSMWS